MKVQGKVTSPGSRPGTDARQPVGMRPLLIVLVLFVVAFGTIYGALFFIAAQTRSDVRGLVQEQCRLSSTSIKSEAWTDSEARLTYVDSTGAHTAIVQIGAGRDYFLTTCGR